MRLLPRMSAVAPLQLLGFQSQKLAAAQADPPTCKKSREKGWGGTTALSLVAIISLRRGDFLFDLDRRDIE
jgi:hypothetical protein